MKKQVLAVLLMAALLIGLVPGMAFAASESEMKITATVPEPSYQMVVPKEANIVYGEESSLLGTVGVTNVQAIEKIVFTAVCTDLEKGEDVIPVTYRYQSGGAESALLRGATVTAFENGKAVDSKIYADVTSADWQAAAPGTYEAKVIFSFDSVKPNRYEDDAMWAFNEKDEDADVDVFFLPPTTVTAANCGADNMPLDNEDLKAKYAIQVKNQKGIYDNVGQELASDPEDPSINTRFFAPFISQSIMEHFLTPNENSAACKEIAYQDAREAFQYYWENLNGGRPVILAGSSAGAEQNLRLLKEFFNTPEAAEKLICCYAIGWQITEDDMAALPYIHFATGEDDTRSVVTFNSEAEWINGSAIVPEGESTLCINPLSWSTGSEKAGKELNLGCSVYSTTKGKKSETPAFCGAYIDPVRGTLKITDLEDPDLNLYKPFMDGQAYGVYHAWDWEFFYRNLEANVVTRINAYLAQ